MGASADGVIVGVGRLAFSVPRGPVTALRRLAGTGMMLEIGGTATGRDEIPLIIEAITPDAIGGTAIGLVPGTNAVMDATGRSALVGRLADRMELTGMDGSEGIATCRASYWLGAGLDEARRTVVSKVRQIWMCIVLVISSNGGFVEYY